MDAWEIGILLEGVLEREKIKRAIATLMEEKGRDGYKRKSKEFEGESADVPREQWVFSSGC